MNMLERAHGAYFGDVLRERVPAQGTEGGLTASRVPQHPDVWTDGSLVSDPSCWYCCCWGLRICSMFLGLVGFVVGEGIWTCYPYHAELGVERCSLYSSVPGPLKTVQRAEMWRVILALQALAPVHLGADNMNVVRQCLSYSFGCLTGAPPGAVY